MSIDYDPTHHLTQNPETQLPPLSTDNAPDVAPLDGSHEDIPHDEVPPLALFNLPELVVDAKVDESTAAIDEPVDTDTTVEVEEAVVESAPEDAVETVAEESTVEETAKEPVDELDSTQEFAAITEEIDDSNDVVDVIDDTVIEEAEVEVEAVAPVEETADTTEEPNIASEVATAVATEDNTAPDESEAVDNELVTASDAVGAVATEQSTATATLEELLATPPALTTQEQPTSAQPETKRPWGKIAAIGATVVSLVAASTAAALIILKPKEEQQPTQGASAVPGTSAEATPTLSAENSFPANATETQIAQSTAAETVVSSVVLPSSAPSEQTSEVQSPATTAAPTETQAPETALGPVYLSAEQYPDASSLVTAFITQSMPAWYNAGATRENADAILRSEKTLEEAALDEASKNAKAYADATFVTGWETDPQLVAQMEFYQYLNYMNLTRYVLSNNQFTSEGLPPYQQTITEGTRTTVSDTPKQKVVKFQYTIHGNELSTDLVNLNATTPVENTNLTRNSQLTFVQETGPDGTEVWKVAVAINEA